MAVQRICFGLSSVQGLTHFVALRASSHQHVALTDTEDSWRSGQEKRQADSRDIRCSEASAFSQNSIWTFFFKPVQYYMYICLPLDIPENLLKSPNRSQNSWLRLTYPSSPTWENCDSQWRALGTCLCMCTNNKHPVEDLWLLQLHWGPWQSRRQEEPPVFSWVAGLLFFLSCLSRERLSPAARTLEVRSKA